MCFFAPSFAMRIIQVPRLTLCDSVLVRLAFGSTKCAFFSGEAAAVRLFWFPLSPQFINAAAALLFLYLSPALVLVFRLKGENNASPNHDSTWNTASHHPFILISHSPALSYILLLFGFLIKKDYASGLIIRMKWLQNHITKYDSHCSFTLTAPSRRSSEAASRAFSHGTGGSGAPLWHVAY